MRVRLIAVCLLAALLLVVGPFQSVALAFDLYDVGGGLMTVVGIPLKASICVVGGVLGFTLYIVTFGSADRASAAVIREGCNHNWIVSGNDIRPDPTSSRVVEWDKQDMKENK
jgi:hypothetical protein